MADLLYLLLTVVTFAAFVGLVRLCDGIVHSVGDDGATGDRSDPVLEQAVGEEVSA